MNNYELLYILPSNITGEEIKSAFRDIEKEILKIGGKKLETLLDHPFLSKTEMSKEEGSEELKNLPVVKRKLAYAIKKNRFGFYCLFNFSSEGNKLKEIDKYLKINKNILRHFILQADPMSKEGLAQLQKLFARKKAEQEKESKKEEAKTTEEQKQKKKDERKISKTEEEKKEEIIPKKDIEKKDEDKKEEADEKITPQESEKEEVRNKENVKEGKEREKKESKKKIKLEDLENKLDEILEDTII